MNRFEKVNVSIAFLFPCFLLLIRVTAEVTWPDLQPDLLPQQGAQRVDWSESPPQVGVVMTE